MKKLSLVTRFKQKIYKQLCCITELDNAINNIKFIKQDENHLNNIFLKSSDSCSMAPIEEGLLVVDFDTNKIISFQKGFLVGTIKRGSENEPLKELYENKLILADTIDYMIDLQPMRTDVYNCNYKEDGKLVKDLLSSLGFELNDNDESLWEDWFKNN